MDANLSIVIAKKPALRNLLLEKGDMPVADYFASLKAKNPIPENLLNILQKHTEQKLDQNILLHTADHIGILNHPFFWTAKVCLPENGPIVVLATSNISPTNSSHPRSIAWHNSNLELLKAHFLSLKWRRYALYGIPALQSHEVEVFTNELPPALKKAIQFSFENSYSEKWLGSQLAIISAEWFKLCFEREIIYLELEKIVNEILITDIANKNSNLHKLCFDAVTRDRYLKAVSGISGAHDHEKSAGSQLFWVLDPQTKTRLSCEIKNNMLVTNKNIQCEITPKNLIEGLKNRTLLPTLALSYCLLAFEYGATLAGGFSQIDYLEDLKNAWTKIFPKSYSPHTNLFTGEMSLSSVTKANYHYPATMADIYLNIANPHSRKKIITDASMRTSLKEAVSNLAVDLSKIVNKKSISNNYSEAKAVINVA